MFRIKTCQKNDIPSWGSYWSSAKTSVTWFIFVGFLLLTVYPRSTSQLSDRVKRREGRTPRSIPQQLFCSSAAVTMDISALLPEQIDQLRERLLDDDGPFKQRVKKIIHETEEDSTNRRDLEDSSKSTGVELHKVIAEVFPAGTGFRDALGYLKQIVMPFPNTDNFEKELKEILELKKELNAIVVWKNELEEETKRIHQWKTTVEKTTLPSIESNVKKLEDRLDIQDQRNSTCVNNIVSLITKVDKVQTQHQKEIEDIRNLAEIVGGKADTNEISIGKNAGSITNLTDEQTRHKKEIAVVRKLAEDTKDKANINEISIRRNGDLITTIKNDLKRQKEGINEQHKSTENTFLKVHFNDSITEAVMQQMLNKSTIHDIVLLLLFCLCGIIVLLIIRRPAQSNQPVVLVSERPQIQHHHRQQQQQRNNHLLKWNRLTEAAVCVVVFHTDTERKHAAETRSVFEVVDQAPPTIHSRVVRGHSDIEDLPGCLVYLVFVDFNERNVILEDPKKGLGDLRVAAVRSLWRFGADVVVIYCQDRGSTNLGEDDLFNRELASVYSQTELSQLRNKARMLSIFDSFTDFQKQHCRKLITEQLRNL